MIECGDRKSARFNNMRVFMQTHNPTIKTNHILSSTHVHISCVRWIVQLNKFNAILTKSERYMQLKWKLFILISKNVERSWTVLNTNWILEENYVYARYSWKRSKYSVYRCFTRIHSIQGNITSANVVCMYVWLMKEKKISDLISLLKLAPIQHWNSDNAFVANTISHLLIQSQTHATPADRS